MTTDPYLALRTKHEKYREYLEVLCSLPHGPTTTDEPTVKDCPWAAPRRLLCYDHGLSTDQLIQRVAKIAKHVGVTVTKVRKTKDHDAYYWVPEHCKERAVQAADKYWKSVYGE